MNKIFKRVFTCIFALILSTTFTTNIFSKTISSENLSDDIYNNYELTTATNNTDLNIKAKSCCLMEAKTGKILYKQNENEKTAPASITKIMSLILIMEAIEKNYFNLKTKITASEHACSMGGSQIWLEPGETMTVDELLRATVIASANDATVALAEAISGSEEGFVKEMNAKCKELKMNNTTFKNATGLDAEGHLTTAKDIATMSKELIKYDLIKKYSTVWMDSLRNGESELVNTNKLVRFYEGCTGLKTGTTGNAGYCLSATAKRNDMELIAVILDGQTSKERFNGASKLLDYGFANYTFKTIEPNTKLLNNIKCKNGLKKDLKITASKKIYTLINKGSNKEINQILNLPKYVTAPIYKGDIIGKIYVEADGEKIGAIPVLADENIVKLNFFSSLTLLLKCILLT